MASSASQCRLPICSANRQQKLSLKIRAYKFPRRTHPIQKKKNNHEANSTGKSENHVAQHRTLFDRKKVNDPRLTLVK